jgi:hypothetical protein
MKMNIDYIPGTFQHSFELGDFIIEPTESKVGMKAIGK